MHSRLFFLLIILIAGSQFFYLAHNFQSKKNIFIVSLPKSASDHISITLADILAYRQSTIIVGHYPDEILDFAMINKELIESNSVVKSHLNPTAINVNFHKKHTKRLVLLIRDPREAVLSWTHHLMAEPHADRPLPEEYYNLSFNQQLDWNIENTLPKMTGWINGWLKVKDEEDSLRILLITYDELNKNELELFEKILDFYDLPESKLKNFKFKPKDQSLHFRKADQNEWRSVLSEKQKQRVAELVPQQLLSRFGWNIHDKAKK